MLAKFVFNQRVCGNAELPVDCARSSQESWPSEVAVGLRVNDSYTMDTALASCNVSPVAGSPAMENR